MVDNKRKVSKQRYARDTYASPKLKVFGPVGALTQSGTGMADENPSMLMMPMDMQNRL